MLYENAVDSRDAPDHLKSNIFFLRYGLTQEMAQARDKTLRRRYEAKMKERYGNPRK